MKKNARLPRKQLQSRRNKKSLLETRLRRLASNKRQETRPRFKRKRPLLGLPRIKLRKLVSSRRLGLLKRKLKKLNVMLKPKQPKRGLSRPREKLQLRQKLIGSSENVRSQRDWRTNVERQKKQLKMQPPKRLKVLRRRNWKPSERPRPKKSESRQPKRRQTSMLKLL